MYAPHSTIVSRHFSKCHAYAALMELVFEAADSSCDGNLHSFEEAANFSRTSYGFFGKPVKMSFGRSDDANSERWFLANPASCPALDFPPGEPPFLAPFFLTRKVSFGLDVLQEDLFYGFETLRR